MALSIQLEPPEFPLSRLLNIAMLDSHARGVSPVRHLRLEGDAPPRNIPRLWRPSALGRCQRAQVYGATGAPKQTLPLDEAQQFVFDRGNVLGAWLAAYIEAACGVPGGADVVEKEGVCVAPELAYGGSCDVYLEVGGHGYIVEVKSKESPKALDKIQAPEPDHLRQLNDYMTMREARAGWVIYFGFHEIEMGERRRMTVRLREFFHRADPKLWDRTRNIIATNRWFFDDRTLLAPKTSNTWMECPTCPWKTLCDREITPAQAQAG